MFIRVFKSTTVSLDQEHEDWDGFNAQTTPELLHGKRRRSPGSADVAQKHRCDLWVRLIVRQIVLGQAADEDPFYDIDRQV